MRLTLAEWTGSVFKIGKLPLAPGTWSSLAAVSIWLLVADSVAGPVFIALTALVAGLGFWSAAVIVRATGERDPSRIVIDEWAGQWTALIALPVTWEYGLAAFSLFRLLDIWKPWPIRALDNQASGWGVMADDLAAGFLTLLILQIYRLVWG